MMPNAFSSPSNLFKLYCPGFFGHAEKRLAKKAKDSFKMYGVKNSETYNYNIYITKNLKK